MIHLRPYQLAAEQSIRKAFVDGYRAPLFVLSTGGGKTVCFASIAHSAAKRAKRVLILCHRVELVDQIVAALKEFDVMPDVIAASYGRTGQAHRTVAVASVQTIIHRLYSYAPPTLIIIDECHHVTPGGQWSTILRAYPEARRLGVTATPIRLDGRGLAAHFDTMIKGPPISELIRDSYLVRPRVFAPPTVDTSGLKIRMGEYVIGESEALIDTPSITGDALSHYRKHSDGKPALVFCTSVAHAHHVAERFNASGVAAFALDGGTDKSLRRGVVADFRRGAIKVLASCDLFSEGFDVPGVHTGILLRPTASLGLFLQQVGRCLRPAPNKDHATILDHVGNTQRFGMPDEDREWTLTADVMRRKSKATEAIRICPKCFSASAARARVCANCAEPFPVEPRQEVTEKEGELVELTPEQIARRKARQLQGRASTLAQLTEFAKMKGYSEGWAAHIWQARQAKRKPKATA